MLALIRFSDAVFSFSPETIFLFRLYSTAQK